MMSALSFLATHEERADKQMIAHDLEYPARLRTLAYAPPNTDRYIVLRDGTEKYAYVNVEFVHNNKDRVFIVTYGLCDGSEKYVYNSRDN